MKQPRLRHLSIDRAGTRKLRSVFSKQNRLSITVNLDTDSLKAVQTVSRRTGIPYRRILSTMLKSTMARQESIQSRLDRLETQLRKLKRHVAA